MVGFLDALCGPSASQLRVKDMDKYAFDPKRLLVHITTIVLRVWKQDQWPTTPPSPSPSSGGGDGSGSGRGLGGADCFTVFPGHPPRLQCGHHEQVWLCAAETDVGGSCFSLSGAAYSQSSPPCTFMITDYSTKISFTGNYAQHQICLQASEYKTSRKLSAIFLNLIVLSAGTLRVPVGIYWIKVKIAYGVD